MILGLCTPLGLMIFLVLGPSKLRQPLPLESARAVPGSLQVLPRRVCKR
jgi:hypothetical protein